MKNAKLILIGVISVVCTGCATQNGVGSVFGGPDVQITATEAGMRAYNDGLSALITNGKASNDAADTPAYGLRREQTAQETERKWGYRPTFKPKLNGVPAQEGSGS